MDVFNEEKKKDLIIGRNAVTELIKSGREIDTLFVLRGEKSGSVGKIYIRFGSRLKRFFKGFIIHFFAGGINKRPFQIPSCKDSGAGTGTAQQKCRKKYQDTEQIFFHCFFFLPADAEERSCPQAALDSNPLSTRTVTGT